MDSTCKMEYLDFKHVLTMLKLDLIRTIFSRAAALFISKVGATVGSHKTSEKSSFCVCTMWSSISS